MFDRILNRNGSDKKCSFVKSDGQRCNAYRQKESEYCVFHDPALEEQRYEVKRQGGRKRSYEKFFTSEGMELIDSPEKVLEGLSEIIFNLKQMDNTPSTARTMIAAYQATLQALEYTSLESRIAEIEKALG